MNRQRFPLVKGKLRRSNAHTRYWSWSFLSQRSKCLQCEQLKFFLITVSLKSSAKINVQPKPRGQHHLICENACTTVDTWTNWVSHVEFRPTLSPIVLMKLGNALRWCDGEKLAWAAARATDSTIHIQSGCLQVRVTCETKLAQIQAPNTHLRPEECNSAPVGPAPAANPLHLQSTCSLHTDWPHSPTSSWAGCLSLWNIGWLNKKLFLC